MGKKFYALKFISLNREKINLLISNLILQVVFVIFAYAGFYKAINFKNFQIQISQSPLMPNEIADYVSIIVPVAEISTSLMLIGEKLRGFGLYVALAMMMIFTLYLISLRYLFSNAPCNCGGVLSGMGYEGHIAFNLLLTLALVWMVLKRTN